jgi:Periplasmic binding protein
MRTIIVSLFLMLGLVGCTTTRPSTGTPTRPTPTRPNQPSNSAPNPGTPGTPPPTKPTPNPPTKPPTETYRVALVLPFLAHQFDANGNVPEKSRFAMQFYGGVLMAVQDIRNQAGYPNLVIDVYDTQGSDTELSALQRNSKVRDANIIIAPPKSDHAAALATFTKTSGQVVLSPESPIAELTSGHPRFVQIKPSLQTHCSRIVQHLRKTRNLPPQQIVLIAKEDESARLDYFRSVNQAIGGGNMPEIIVPNASTNFDKIDLRKHLKTGQTTAFVLPTWAGQDWVLAFLSRLKATKGSHKVEVYGMPQWMAYDQIEPELMSELGVHITSSSWVDRSDQNTQAFERRFFETYGTLPDDDAYNGYDVTLFLAESLRKYGIEFPNHVQGSNAFTSTMRGGFFFRMHTNTDSSSGTADYIENIYVHLLKFDQYGWKPVE